MKIAHIADLHLGKKMNGVDLLEDQRYILNQIYEHLIDQEVKVLMISGDVFDRSVAPSQAMQLFEKFLMDVSSQKIKTLVISGNHDHATRLEYAGQFMRERGVYIAGVYQEEIEMVEIEDCCFYLLPFIKPIHVRTVLEADVSTYTEAISKALSTVSLDKKKKNILLAHQFVVSTHEPLLSDSEIRSVGNLDQVDSYVFDGFNYVALGHLHRPQWINSNIRYAGSPLKYSFSEANDQKTLTILNTEDLLDPLYIPLHALHDVKIIRGKYDEVIRMTPSNDYIKIVLTDTRRPQKNVLEVLRKIFPNVLSLSYEMMKQKTVFQAKNTKALSEVEMFENFFKRQLGREASVRQIDFVKQALEDIRNEN